MKRFRVRSHVPRVLLSTLALLVAAAFQAPAQVPASLGEDDAFLRDLAIRSGQVLSSSHSPWSGSATLAELSSLQEHAAEDTVTEIEYALAEWKQDDSPMISIGLTTRYERYFRPPTARTFAERLEMVDPIAVMQMSYQTGLSLAAFIDVAARREFRLLDTPDNLFSSMPANPVALENNFVERGYLLYAPGPFAFVFGRQPFSIGPSPLTSLVVSRAVPYLDALDVDLSLGRLHMTLLVSTLENRKALTDVTIEDPSPYDFGGTVILHNIHYFEYDFDFLRVGVGGQVIITRPGNAFQISDFFPVFSWHNASIKPNNLTLTVDISAVPFPGFEIYLQYGFDDINASIFGADSGIPNIDAGLVGVTWTDRWPRSSLDAVLEAGFTHYLWGSFDDGVPLARAIDRILLDGMGQWIPLNSPYGPGTAWLLARATFVAPWAMDIAASFELLSRNPLASLLGAYEANDVVESAHRELSLRAGVEVSYSPWKWLRVSIEPQFCCRDGKSWLELTIGAGTVHEARRRIGPGQGD